MEYRCRKKCAAVRLGASCAVDRINASPMVVALCQDPWRFLRWTGLM